jgi:hypothetical protein
MAAENAQYGSLVYRNANHHVVSEHACIDPLKNSMFGGFSCADVARQASRCCTKHRALPTEAPPKFANGLAAVVIALRFHSIHYALESPRVGATSFIKLKPEEVDQVALARPLQEIFATQVAAN